MIKNEAKRLYDMGWAVHWIEPNAKRPVGRWKFDGRHDWPTLERTYKKGMGLGVKLGPSSRLPGGYLANIDVDIKSGEERHRAEALALVETLFPEVVATAPLVRTGYGLRFFVLVEGPATSQKLGASAEETVVFMPGEAAGTRQKAAVKEGRITEEQLKAGYRLRPAWEVEFMSLGRQVVLPPSVHPSTGEPYVWERPVTEKAVIPLVQCTEAKGSRPRGRPAGSTVVQRFQPVQVDLIGSKLKSPMVDLILSGKGLEERYGGDRSNACLGATLAMLRAGFSDMEIMSVLTEPNSLGEAALERRGGNRASAAAWVRDFCLAKAKKEIEPFKAFRDAPLAIADKTALNPEVKPQMSEGGEDDWQARLKRYGKNGDGAIKTSMENTVLVLQSTAGKDVVRLDTFAVRDSYSRDTPWGGKAGETITDKDALRVQLWLGRTFDFEPSVSTADNALIAIAEQNKFHPVQDMLRALPPWDGVPRLDTWLVKYFGAHGPVLGGVSPGVYFGQIMSKWLLAAVARVFYPGTDFQWIPILQGVQDSGKSHFGEYLGGKDYYLEGLPDLKDKDAALNLQGSWFVEFGELNNIRGGDIDIAKAYLTRATDKCRPPYGKRIQTFKRQCVFYGTTDKFKYLRDEQGNRRFDPVMVGRLNFKALFRDRDQLWAETMFAFDNLYTGHLDLELTDDAKIYSNLIQADKMVEDDSSTFADLVDHYFFEDGQLKPQIQLNPAKFKLLDLFSQLGPLTKYKYEKRTEQLLVKALKVLNARNFHTKWGNFWGFDPG